MSFKITIEETKDVVKKIGHEWKIIGTEEVDREPKYFQENIGEPKTRIREVYDYTPEIEKTVEVTTRILEQTVDELDLAAVIRAINKLD